MSGNFEVRPIGTQARLAQVEAQREALLEALEVARRVITNDRESIVECSTYPDGTMDRDAADYVAYYDAALKQIDEALDGR
jgi:hypothetical protein